MIGIKNPNLSFDKSGFKKQKSPQMRALGVILQISRNANLLGG